MKDLEYFKSDEYKKRCAFWPMKKGHKIFIQKAEIDGQYLIGDKRERRITKVRKVAKGNTKHTEIQISGFDDRWFRVGKTHNILISYPQGFRAKKILNQRRLKYAFEYPPEFYKPEPEPEPQTAMPLPSFYEGSSNV